jgi:hypothetical protein
MRTPRRSSRWSATGVVRSTRCVMSSYLLATRGSDRAHRHDVLDKSPWWRHLSHTPARIGFIGVLGRSGRCAGGGQEFAS